MHILIIGGVSYDDIIQVEKFFNRETVNVYAKETYSMVGSTGAGKAIALKRLGFDVTLIAAVGEDTYGTRIKNRMQEENIEFFKIPMNQTERHTNIMEASGKRISIFHPGVTKVQIESSAYKEIIQRADLVCLNIKAYAKAFIPLLTALKKKIFVDIHDYDGEEAYHQPFIDVANILMLSSENLPQYQRFMQTQLEKGKEIVLCTHAEKGATLLTSKNLYQVDGRKVDVIDTNGAGDNFSAGFIYGLMHQMPLLNCLHLGRNAAEMCIQSKDIVHPNLNEDEIQKNL